MLISTIFKYLLKKDLIKLGRMSHNSSKISKMLRYFGVPLLKSIFICPSHECNANCVNCYEVFSHEKFQKFLTTQQIRNVIDQFHQLGGQYVVFCSGEFLLRKDALDLIRYVRLKKMFVKMATNGILLDQKKVDDLKRVGLSELIVSIDSADAATHDRLRGVKGCFEKAVNGIRIAKNKGITTSIWTYVTKTNFNELASISNLGKELNVDSIFTFFTLLSGHLFNKFDENLTYQEREAFRKQFNESNVELEFRSEKDPCRGGGLEHICVMPSGDVTFCPPVPYSYGNIASKPLKDALKDIVRDHKRFSHCRGECIVNFKEYREKCRARFIYE